jgi:hypothetical protein
MKTYIGVKIVQAEPEIKDGKEGYKVTYIEDAKPGEKPYSSWCPKNIFETHNREVAGGGVPFAKALEALQRGEKVARKGWNGKGMWVQQQVPDEHSKMTLPYLYIEYPPLHPAYPNGSRVPWLASQTDLLSDDWFIVE